MGIGTRPPPRPWRRRPRRPPLAAGGPGCFNDRRQDEVWPREPRRAGPGNGSRSSRQTPPTLLRSGTTRRGGDRQPQFTLARPERAWRRWKTTSVERCRSPVSAVSAKGVGLCSEDICLQRTARDGRSAARGALGGHSPRQCWPSRCWPCPPRSARWLPRLPHRASPLTGWWRRRRRRSRPPPAPAPLLIGGMPSPLRPRRSPRSWRKLSAALAEL